MRGRQTAWGRQTTWENILGNSEETFSENFDLTSFDLLLKPTWFCSVNCPCIFEVMPWSPPSDKAQKELQKKLGVCNMYWNFNLPVNVFLKGCSELAENRQHITRLSTYYRNITCSYRLHMENIRSFVLLSSRDVVLPGGQHPDILHVRRHATSSCETINRQMCDSNTAIMTHSARRTTHTFISYGASVR